MADWDKLGDMGNVEDRRGMSPAALGGGGLGIVGLVLVFAFSVLGGSDPSTALNDALGQLGQSQVTTQQAPETGQFAGADQYETFASTVLGSNNRVWKSIFEQSGKTYTEPRLVLFRTATQSGCGTASSQVGPHYCPADSTIYLDETFFDELQQRFKAKGGDVAEAYVISHEVAHHVQNQLGIMARVQRSNSGEANQQSVNLELQADCFAGVWAHSVNTQGVFEPGEINEALDAAAAVGDDRIQQQTQGTINPETWTHGSSQERSTWFNRGFTTGKPSACDTFRT